jgi:hypothetical protein
MEASKLDDLEKMLESVTETSPWQVSSSDFRPDALSGIDPEKIDEDLYKMHHLEVAERYENTIREHSWPEEAILEIAQNMLGPRKTEALLRGSEDGTTDIESFSGQIALAMQMSLVEGDLYCELTLRNEHLIKILSLEEKDPIYKCLSRHIDLTSLVVEKPHDTSLEEFLELVTGLVIRATTILHVAYGVHTSCSS